MSRAAQKRLPSIGKDPLVNLMIREMNRQGIGWKKMATLTGLHYNTLRGWAGIGPASRKVPGVDNSIKTVRQPSLQDLQRVLRILGIELWAVRVENLPARHPGMDPITQYHRETMKVHGYEGPPDKLKATNHPRIKRDYNRKEIQCAAE